MLCGDGARALERSNLAERIGVLLRNRSPFAQSGVREQLDQQHAGAGGRTLCLRDDSQVFVMILKFRGDE